MNYIIYSTNQTFFYNKTLQWIVLINAYSIVKSSIWCLQILVQRIEMSKLLVLDVITEIRT
jgi:hypothetical protein